MKVHAGGPVSGACGTHHFRYTRGDIDLVPANVSDTWYEDAASTSVVVRIAPSLLVRAAEETGRDTGLVALEPRHQFRDVRMEHIAWALKEESEAGFPNGLIYSESLGLALAVHILGHYPVGQRVNGELSRSALRRVTAFIEEHLDEDLSLTRLASVSGLSGSHFRILFKRSTGVPVHAYVIQRRVERAKTLLLEGKVPKSQIALEAGFAHQSHMAKCMRRVLGVVPGDLTPRS